MVMSVYNGARNLHDSIQSVLTQSGVNLEFIIIDDGSTDESSAILTEVARNDPRVRLTSRKNTGLTRALIEGCSQARAPIIARQDAGDRSLPGRLEASVAAMTGSPDAVMISCATRFVSPYGDFIRTVLQEPGELHQGLGETHPKLVFGPSHHGATIFRRDTYDKVGGYRAEFSVAQDLDLWMRLREEGRCVSLPQIGYEAELSPGSISFSRKSEQDAAFQTILLASSARRFGRSDREIISGYEARQLARSPRPRDPEKDFAAYCYFIAGLLRSHDPVAAQNYMRSALARSPINLRYFYRYLRMVGDTFFANRNR